MKCPHCRLEIHEAFRETSVFDAGSKWLGRDASGTSCTWSLFTMSCPACNKVIAFLRIRSNLDVMKATYMVYPRKDASAVAPPEVPPELAEDFNEACLVLTDSPKASAALSRRCLQGILRGNGFTQNDLAPAIQALLDAKVLPSWLADNVDTIRNIGNFAAHPMKNKNSGQILPVEPHEAEWNLQVLQDLFDHFYVAPAKNAVKRDALNLKLASAGKPASKVEKP